MNANISSIWMIDSAAATGRLKIWTAWRYISTSMVEYLGPPRIRMTPKLLKQKMNTSSDAARIAGLKRGKVTSQKILQDEAPSIWAASLIAGWSLDQKPPTMRTITI